MDRHSACTSWLCLLVSSWYLSSKLRHPLSPWLVFVQAPLCPCFHNFFERPLPLNVMRLCSPVTCSLFLSSVSGERPTRTISSLLCVTPLLWVHPILKYSWQRPEFCPRIVWVTFPCRGKNQIRKHSLATRISLSRHLLYEMFAEGLEFPHPMLFFVLPRQHESTKMLYSSFRARWMAGVQQLTTVNNQLDQILPYMQRWKV